MYTYSSPMRRVTTFYRAFFGAVAIAVVGLGGARPAQAIDLELYAKLLQHYSHEVPDTAGTRVDYEGLRATEDWPRLVASVAGVNPAKLETEAAKKAFWINAYNILAIDWVVRGRPEASIRDLGSFFSPVWKKRAGRVGGANVTLDHIEHGILRPMGDPRIHGAIVCASVSCPSLLREPFRADTLDAQFEVALRSWLADPRKGVRIDRAAGRAELSSIFKWFAEDFEPRGVLAFAAAYLPEADAKWLRERAEPPDIRYLDYDWNLNRWRP